MTDTPKPKKLSGTSFYYGDDYKYTPDSLELEVAFWETYRSDVLINEYRAGRKLSDIANDRGSSPQSLRVYFTRRYGKRWKIKRKNVQPKPRYSLTIGQILKRLADGERQVDIAATFGVPAHVVYSRIKSHKERTLGDETQTQPNVS